MRNANVDLASMMNKSLQLRIITAVILMLGLIAMTTLLSPFNFAIVLAVIVLMASWEWSGLIGLQSRRSRMLYQATVLVMLVSAFLLLGVVPGAELIDGLRASMLLLLGMLWWMVAFTMLIGYPENAGQWNDKSRIGLMGVLALLPTWAGVVMLKFLAPDGYLVISLVLMVAAVDVGAYFAGTYLGHNKLAPNLSPNKSWEGVWGGLITCLVLGIALIIFHHQTVATLSLVQVIVLLVLCPLVTLFAVIGDLVESMLKRNSQVKDSGQLLPGHGGVLDRVDALIAVTPIYVLTVMLTLFEVE